MGGGTVPIGLTNLSQDIAVVVDLHELFLLLAVERSRRAHGILFCRRTRRRRHPRWGRKVAVGVHGVGVALLRLERPKAVSFLLLWTHAARRSRSRDYYNSSPGWDHTNMPGNLPHPYYLFATEHRRPTPMIQVHHSYYRLLLQRPL